MRPVTQDGHLLRYLSLSVKVREKYTGHIGRQEDEDVPEAVEVGEAQHLPHGAEETVEDPGREGYHPHGTAPHPQPVHLDRVTPRQGKQRKLA